MLRTSELQSKEVINLNTGQRLGMIADVDLDLSVGEIKGVVIPKEKGVFSFFGASDDLYIPWQQVHKIGEDVILVESGNELAEEGVEEN